MSMTVFVAVELVVIVNENVMRKTWLLEICIVIVVNAVYLVCASMTKI